MTVKLPAAPAVNVVLAPLVIDGASLTVSVNGWLASGATPLEAARLARKVASEAVANGLRELGSGPGPVDVFDLAARFRP